MALNKVEQRRFAKEAKKNIAASIECNLSALEKSLLAAGNLHDDIPCLREVCTVQRQCDVLLKESIRIIDGTKSNFKSTRLAELRGKMQDFLDKD